MLPLEHHRFDELLAAISAKTPTPGGGAVASATGAIACALAGMVVSYSLGKKDLLAHQPALDDARKQLERARALFLQLASEDEQAYAWLNSLQKLPESDAKRASEYPQAVQAAISAPLNTLAAACDIARLAKSLVPITNKWLRSDLAISAILTRATAQSSACNVRINLPLITDAKSRAALEAQTSELVHTCERITGEIEKACV
jgi:formiminotetrahydrofolate cyclodeaminase